MSSWKFELSHTLTDGTYQNTHSKGEPNIRDNLYHDVTKVYQIKHYKAHRNTLQYMISDRGPPRCPGQNREREPHS